MVPQIGTNLYILVEWFHIHKWNHYGSTWFSIVFGMNFGNGSTFLGKLGKWFHIGRPTVVPQQFCNFLQRGPGALPATVTDSVHHIAARFPSDTAAEHQGYLWEHLTEFEIGTYWHHSPISTDSSDIDWQDATTYVYPRYRQLLSPSLEIPWVSLPADSPHQPADHNYGAGRPGAARPRCRGDICMLPILRLGFPSGASHNECHNIGKAWSWSFAFWF